MDLANLAQIRDHPGVVSTELAAEVAQERAYKLRVRRLKALGLTESLEIGYLLSPRGAARWRLTVRLTVRPASSDRVRQALGCVDDR